MQFNLGPSYVLAQRYDDAIAAGRRSLAISPKRTVAHYVIGEAMLLKHDAAGALAEFQQEPSDTWKALGLPMAFHALGREKEANAALESIIARYKEGSSFNIAEVYAFRGEPDNAFEWLDNAVAYHDTGLPMVPIDPLLESLHQDPRWVPFLRKIGRAPDQLAAIKFDIRIPGE
jgi:tetratricopeptide (TPR) repeat protein